MVETWLEWERHGEAGATVIDLLTVAPASWTERARVAALLGRCARLARDDNRLPDEARQYLAGRHGDRAIALLRSATADGFRDGKLLESSDFDALRDRADFRAVFAQVAAER
jgi:hypothetical protein